MGAQSQRFADRLYSLFDWHAPALLSPLDYAGRVATDKRRQPPRHLRREVGPLQNFESSAAEFIAYLKLLCGLGPGSRFLDIGCGCGAVALQLTEYFQEGSYVGIDIQQEAIAWCSKHVTGAGMSFQRADLRSMRYNPDGSAAASEYHFPFSDESFDVVLLKSVFTHVTPPGVGNYLREIARMLTTDGRCLATFFLLADGGHVASPFNFQYGDDDFRYVSEESPEEVCAHNEGRVRDMIHDAGLGIDGPIRYGTWSGRSEGLSFQDIAVLTRLAPNST